MIENPPAERAVLGAAMLGKAGRDALLLLADDDFVELRHRVIAAALRDMIRRGEQPDSLTLAAELGRRGTLDGPGSAGGALYLAELAAQELVSANGPYYAEILRSTTRARLVEQMGVRLAALGRGNDWAQGDAAGELEPVLARHREELDSLPAALDGSATEPLPTIADLMGMEFTHDWLIDGLLERGERIVTVAGEGAGKSTLATQWAICLAGGLHPFTGRRFGSGLRVLLIDAENSAAQTQRRYGWVGYMINRLSPEAGWAKRIWHQIKPEGLDLAGRDRAWLMRVAAEASPDLVVIGPAYKIMRGDPNKDADVLALFSVLDELRVKHGAALMIEAHAGHARVGEQRAFRPYGSSVWLRWPEVGIGLARSEADLGEAHPTALAVGHWRGTREERDWPQEIERGACLPWQPAGWRRPGATYEPEDAA